MTPGTWFCGPSAPLRRGLLAVVAMLGLGFANAAFADFMEVAVSAGAGADQHRNGDTASNVLGDPEAFASTSANNGAANGSAAGRAAAGSLGIYMQAATPAPDVVQVDSSALFRDVLLVSAPLLPIGTPVQLVFDLQPPPDEAVGTCSACFIGYVRARLDLVIGVAIRDEVVTWVQGVNGFSDYSGSFTTMLARVGDRIQIEGSLIGQLVVGAPNGAASFQIDLLNTVPFFADALTDGVSLIAESGHDYGRSAVPEPASLWLLLAGLALLLVLQRQRRDRMAARPLLRPSA